MNKLPAARGATLHSVSAVAATHSTHTEHTCTPHQITTTHTHTQHTDTPPTPHRRHHCATTAAAMLRQQAPCVLPCFDLTALTGSCSVLVIGSDDVYVDLEVPCMTSTYTLAAKPLILPAAAAASSFVYKSFVYMAHHSQAQPWSTPSNPMQ